MVIFDRQGRPWPSFADAGHLYLYAKLLAETWSTESSENLRSIMTCAAS